VLCAVDDERLTGFRFYIISYANHRPTRTISVDHAPLLRTPARAPSDHICAITVYQFQLLTDKLKYCSFQVVRPAAQQAVKTVEKEGIDVIRDTT